MPLAARRRDRRIELRTTPEERALIDSARAVSGMHLTDFVIREAVDGARRVLADRTTFALTGAARDAWDAINARPARDLPSLRSLMEHPSPFGE